MGARDSETTIAESSNHGVQRRTGAAEETRDLGGHKVEGNL